jgi:hypothetical protein
VATLTSFVAFLTRSRSNTSEQDAEDRGGDGGRRIDLVELGLLKPPDGVGESRSIA